MDNNIFDLTTFDPDQLLKVSKEQLKDDCWIYFLFNNDNLVYIGKTTNGISRIRSHVNGINGYGLKEFTHYSFVQVERRYLDACEKRLIRHFKPKFNKAGTKS